AASDRSTRGTGAIRTAEHTTPLPVTRQAEVRDAPQMLLRRGAVGEDVSAALLALALPPPPNRERLPGIILRSQGEHVPFDHPVPWPVDAERASDQRFLSLENVGQGVILQIDCGTALAGDHAVPDVDTGRPQQIRRRFVGADIHREIAARVVDERALPLEHDWGFSWRAHLERLQRPAPLEELPGGGQRSGAGIHGSSFDGPLARGGSTCPDCNQPRSDQDAGQHMTALHDEHSSTLHRGHAGETGWEMGKRHRSVTPRSRLFSAVMRPPCEITIDLLMARPRPSPWGLNVTNGSNTAFS